MSILVVDQRHVHRPILYEAQNIKSVCSIGHDRRLPHVRADVRSFPAHVGIEQVFGLHNAEHVFRCALVDRQPRMNAGNNDLACPRRIIGQIDHVDVASWRHHRPNWPVAKPHHAGDHGAFSRLQHAGTFCFRNQCTDFFIRHALARL